MTKPLLDRNTYDHPEHFDDAIRAYRASSRYIPTPLESLLFELCGHRCSICRAPWLEIHHIDELGDGGRTEYENLIVLCPNCHARVHAENVPSKEELRHYKLKQEVSYELPVMSRLTEAEREFVVHVADMAGDDRLSYSKRTHKDVPTGNHDDAVHILRKEVGFFALLEAGMVSVDLENSIGLDSHTTSVALRVRLTGKGFKWVKYMVESHRVPRADAQPFAEG